MPINGAGNYVLPSGTTVTTGTTIASSPYNAFLADLETVLNLPKTIAQGGTGGATVSAAQTNLQVKPGTHTLAYNARVQSLADLVGAADKLPYLSGANTFAQADLSAYMRGLLATADQATLFGANLNDIIGLSLSQGDLLYRDGSQVNRLAAGTNGDLLQSGGAGANPSWVTVARQLVNYDDAVVTASVALGGGSFSATPLVTEGTEIIKISSYTPASSDGILEIDINLSDVANVGDDGANFALFVGSTFIYRTKSFASQTHTQAVPIAWRYQLASDSTIDISLRGIRSGGTSTTVNDSGSADSGSLMRVREWKAPPL